MVSFSSLDKKGSVESDAAFQKYSRDDAISLELPMRVFADHIQPQLEILSIVTGALTVKLDTQPLELSVGDAVIINPYTLHGGFMPSGVSECSYFCVSIDLPFFAPCLPELEQGLIEKITALKSGFQSFVGADKASGILETSRELYKYQREWRSAYLSAASMKMLAILFESFYDYSFTPKSKNTHFIRDICEYVYKHYPERITTASVSEYFGISEGYFCRLFRNCFPTSFTSYLTEFRVNAAMALRGKSKSLKEIAAAVGFADYSAFYRAFKSVTGMNAKQYFG